MLPSQNKTPLVQWTISFYWSVLRIPVLLLCTGFNHRYTAFTLRRLLLLQSSGGSAAASVAQQQSTNCLPSNLLAVIMRALPLCPVADCNAMSSTLSSSKRGMVRRG